ncbi:FeoA family protein [Jiulongibacter sp. NS-SX5]|uniref:FeoA family protein n=1 Tax=Jiulongibacter sp. NS-SX5 TaxID=3463854 RepID=UPI004059F102
MSESSLTLADIPKGGKVEVVGFNDIPLSLRLMEFGCIPGVELKVDLHAPLGCPVCVSLDGDYHISLRRSEAETIEVKLV